MEPLSPVPPVTSLAARWLDQRRRNLELQLAAAERERWDEVERLMEEARRADPPADPGGSTGSDVASLLAQADALTRRLADARSRLLADIHRAPEPLAQDTSGREAPKKGERLDGYV